MERIFDDSESRRRAEEIYSRRNGCVKDDYRKKYFSIYKVLFQILVLINLSLVFVFYSNKDYIFSNDFLNQVNEFYNINIIEKINTFFELNESTENESQNEINQNSIEKDSYSFIRDKDKTITFFII